MSTVGVLFHSVDPFLDAHLISMLGAPDAAADVLNFIGAAGDAIDLLIGPNLNPLRVTIDELRVAALDLIKGWVETEFGIPVASLENALRDPASLLDGGAGRYPWLGRSLHIRAG